MMIKKIYKRLLPLLMVLWLLPGTALAGEDASLAAAFRQGDQFCGFVVLDGELPPPKSATLQTGILSMPLIPPPAKLSESGVPVSCLLLVDCSTSMKNLGKQVTAFAKALAENDNTGARFALATFGEAFSPVWDGEDGEGSIAEAAGQISYTAQRTDLSRGILDAIDYLSSDWQRKSGELINLVIITDGIPKDSEDSPAIDEVAARLREDTSVLVHTFGISASSKDSAAAMEALGTLGYGLHTTAGKNSVSEARDRAVKTAAFINNLCAVSFTWDPQDDDARYGNSAEIRFSREDESTCVLTVDMAAVPVLDSPEEGTEIAKNPENSESPENSAEPVRPEISNGSDSSDSSEDSQDSESPKGSVGQADQKQPDNPDSIDNGGGSPDKKPGIPWFIWAVGGAACAALAAAFLFLRRRRKPAGERPKGSIPMRIEVICGSYAGESELYLIDELIVGRGGRCGIPWRDKGVSRRNSRIFLRDGMIYIEDLGSQQGTALGGMRLHDANRLRSGEEISVGTVRFRLKF